MRTWILSVPCNAMVGNFIVGMEQLKHLARVRG